MGPVPVAEGNFFTVAERKLQGFYRNEVLLAKFFCHLRGSNYGARGPVTDTATVEKTKWKGNHGRIQYLLLRNLFSEMCLPIQCAIFMTLCRNMGHGLFQIFHLYTILGGVAAGQHSKATGSSHIGKPQ